MSTRLDSIHSAGLEKPGAISGLLNNFARRIVLSRLNELQNGQIIVVENGKKRFAVK